jgi:hypothetical protein
MELSGKIAIITGASRGIGRALAKELLTHNCGLLLTGLEEDELASFSKELRLYSSTVATMAADLSNPQGREDFIKWILEQKAPPDILVNNAGMGGDFGKFAEVELSRIERTIALNVSALIHLTHELIPLLKGRPQAKIVNVSSGIARLPYPGLAVYGATKGFISSFSESLSCELAGTSIDLLCFHPGFTVTPFITTSKMDLGKISPRLLHTPEEVASRIVQAMKKDRYWGYSDLVTELTAYFGGVLPPWLKRSVFKNLFWRVPGEK